MAILDKYNFEDLKNEAERLVFDELEYQLGLSENEAICRCNDCVLDMAAFALNSVKPYYRVSLLGNLYAKNADKGEYGEQVKAAVTTAIKKIAANPSHD